nr:DUF2243 domain-containing protein [Deinococcus hopiensis]
MLRQILQWHHLVSSRYLPNTVHNLKVNTLADGLFHAATCAFTAVGLACLWSGTRRRHAALRTPAFTGTLLLAGACRAAWRGWSTTSCSEYAPRSTSARL